MRRPARTSYVVLGILAQSGPMSGYDLRKWIEQSIAHFWSESFGQIYPVLADLSKRGLVRPAAVGAGGRRERIVYRITPAGRGTLREWLGQPAEPQPPRLEYLVKLFFGVEVPRDVSRGHIERIRSENARRAEWLEKLDRRLRREAASEPGLPFWLMTIRHGRMACETRVRWADEAMKLLTLKSADGRRARQRSRQTRSPPCIPLFLRRPSTASFRS